MSLTGSGEPERNWIQLMQSSRRLNRWLNSIIVPIWSCQASSQQVGDRAKEMTGRRTPHPTSELQPARCLGAALVSTGLCDREYVPPKVST